MRAWWTWLVVTGILVGLAAACGGGASVDDVACDFGEQTAVTVQITDENGEPLEPGEFNETFDGESTVPYQDVFRGYEQAMQEALESGYIPISLRDIIHAYFSSLEP